MQREKIEFSSTTPSFIKKLLDTPVQKPIARKEPVDEGPVVVNEIKNTISEQRENKIIEIGAKKLQKQKKPKNTLTLNKTARSGIEKTKKSIQLLSFSDQQD